MKCLLEERGKITFAIRNADSDSYIGYVSHYKGRWRVRNADCDEIAAALLEGTMRGCPSENDRPKADMNYLHNNAYPFERVGKNSWKWGVGHPAAAWRWAP